MSSGIPRTEDGPAADDDRSIAELVKDLSEQTSHLVRDEIRLAQAEMKDKAKHAGIGAGMFGAAGMVTLFGVAALIAAGIAALALVLPVWAAALIVGAALLLLAGGLALTGKGQLSQASPKPERTVENVKLDVEELKEVKP